MRWLWAAYQLGMWRDLMDSGLTQPAFADRALEVIAAASYDWMLEAKGEEGVRPVALILANKVGRGLEPYVEWFPWASARNKLECTAVFLKEIAKQHKIFVFAEEKSEGFWVKFIRYGMIRRGCKVLDYFSRGEHAMLYYTVGT
jgi:hypothetical protein